MLEDEHGASLRIVDLRWLAPIDEDRLMAAVEPCRRVLVVDECRVTGSQSEALVTLVNERLGDAARETRLAAEDCFIPLGPAATSTLPSKDSIVAEALELLGEP